MRISTASDKHQTNSSLVYLESLLSSFGRMRTKFANFSALFEMAIRKSFQLENFFTASLKNQILFISWNP